ncbi:MAG: Mut7-C RNAse domain-containing protein [Nitrospirae bacterium]|nr:Mut7-C RNAse domain-containing protein [Nitrospirota bacterium]
MKAVSSQQSAVSSERERKFAADVMLGRLARWLRVLGFDTYYDREAEDDALIALCRREGRVLLTRDGRLARRRTVPHAVLLREEDPDAQLREVAGVFGIRRPLAFLSRCPLCNAPLVETPRAALRGEVPPYVWKTQRVFARCPRCRKVFWGGTHVGRIRARLSKLGLLE